MKLGQRQRNFNSFHIEDLFSSSNQSEELDYTEYQIRESFECVQNKHLMGEQGREEEALQVVEYEAKTEPLLDFDESFSSMDDNFHLVLTSTGLEFLKQ